MNDTNKNSAHLKLINSNEEVIMNKKSKISIGNVDEELKTDFTSYAREHNLTQGQLLIKIWDNFKRTNITFNEDEQNIIDQAITIAGGSFYDLIKRNIVKTAKRVITDKNPLNTDKAVRNSYYAANLRIEEIVQEMMDHNKNTNYWYERKFLSKKAIAEYAKIRKTKVEGAMSLNTKVITRYLLSHQKEIDEHHEKYNLNEKHNLKAYQYSLNVGRK
jgi:uncharacterized protein (DUF1778 family)